MEQNFNRDEFEQMLRDTTEDFRMYPSRKVWHSIYNDLHPDRKWPSLAVCLLLLTAILYTGISNNNNISKESKNLLASSLNSETNINNVEAENGEIIADKQQTNKTTILSNSHPTIESGILKIAYSKNDNTSDNLYLKEERQNSDKHLDTKNTDAKTKMTIVAGQTNESISNDPLEIDFNEQPILANRKIKTELTENTVYDNTPGESTLVINEKKLPVYDSLKSQELNTSKIKKEAVFKFTMINTEEKEWLEDHAFHNTRNPNKWKAKLSVEYYITPSVGYRQLYKNNDFEPAGGLLQRTAENNNYLSQQAALNFEAGVAMLFKLNKKINVSAGLQLNYTNYITYAHHLQHPTQTTVLMNDPHNGNLMPMPYNSIYGNVLGSNTSKLNNNTYQISMPIGLQYKLAGNDKVKWQMAASVQPSYIMSGNTYLISANNKNFVIDQSMLRNWNVSTSIESFVSFKTPGDLLLNVGPQFRYQILSTYSNQYSYTEKLYNVGLKLGITKKL